MNTDFKFIIPLSISVSLIAAQEMEYIFQTTMVDEIRVSIRILSFFILIIIIILFYCSSATKAVVKGYSVTDDLFGNITVINEPVQIVEIEDGFIPIGEAHTFVYYLEEGHKYHIYLSGEWADPNIHKTDYDVYVYRFIGATANLISTHTESAGLIEQVWNDGNGQFFIPSATQLYYFTIRNDAIESSAAEPATLMIIEHIEKNKWHSRWMEGKVEEVPVDDTLWSYEFFTSANEIKVYINVPESLDMYEARLYVMGNPAVGKGELIGGIPIAWEPGLRGMLSKLYGGFNFDPQGFRHIEAMASCERNGEDMLIEYEAPIEGELLYHLVLIAEYGVGNIKFMVQTDLKPPDFQLINPPEVVSSRDEVKLEFFIHDETEIINITGKYTEDAGKNWKKMKLVSEETGNYSVMIYDKLPGVSIEYVFEAEDIMGNKGEVRGSYMRSCATSTTCFVSDSSIEAGNGVTLWGALNIKIPDVQVEIIVHHLERVEKIYTKTSANGSYNITFEPDSIGSWIFQAKIFGDGFYYESSESELVELEVVTPKMITIIKKLPSIIMVKIGWILKPPYLYGVVGILGIAGGGLVFYLWRRE